MQKKLSEFKKDDKGTIIEVLGIGKLRQRLFDMGLTPGAFVVFKKKAPLGDPIEVNVRGYFLSLRKEEAKLILLEVAK